MATKKATKKKSTKPAAKKSSTRKKSTARKSSTKSASRKKAGSKRASNTRTKSTAVERAEGTLHNVARSVGSTLGTWAKKTSKAVDAAKNALPFGSDHEESSGEE